MAMETHGFCKVEKKTVGTVKTRHGDVPLENTVPLVEMRTLILVNVIPVLVQMT